MKRYGQELRRLRTERGLLQNDVAELVGIRRDSYGAIERGETGPSKRVRSTVRKWIGEKQEKALYEEALQERKEEKQKTRCLIFEGGHCTKNICCAFCDGRNECEDACQNSPDKCNLTYKG